MGGRPALRGGKQDVTPAAAQQTALGYLVVIFVVFVGSCWYILTPDDSPEAQVERALRNARAITAAICEMEMTARLPSPESADYPFGQVAAVQALGQDRFRLRSYVDSQDTLGTLVRTEFDCIVRGTGVEFSAYTLVSLEVE